MKIYTLEYDHIGGSTLIQTQNIEEITDRLCGIVDDPHIIHSTIVIKTEEKK